MFRGKFWLAGSADAITSSQLIRKLLQAKNVPRLLFLNSKVKDFLQSSAQLHNRSLLQYVPYQPQVSSNGNRHAHNNWKHKIDLYQKLGLNKPSLLRIDISV